MEWKRKLVGRLALKINDLFTNGHMNTEKRWTDNITGLMEGCLNFINQFSRLYDYPKKLIKIIIEKRRSKLYHDLSGCNVSDES